MSNDNFIWIFGENHGATTNNNSYFFWKHAVNIKDNIDKYIIFKKNENTLSTFKNLSEYEKKFVIWKNSLKHFKLYEKADMFFVTLSYKDITPNKMLLRKFGVKIKKPVVYLRHGTTGMKRTYYTGKSYWNNMFRFLSYNTKEPEHLVKYNDFKPYQIYSNDYHPRYGEFLRKDDTVKDKNQILWFLTWREYFGKNSQTRIFTKLIRDVLSSEKLKQYLKRSGLILRLCVHQFFDEETFKDIYSEAEEGLIEIVHSKEVDVMEEMVKSSLLITDYSSVAYDFTFLNRPVLLYQPDLEVYSKTREFFCEIEEMERYNITNAETLVEHIVNENYDINPFFSQVFPEKIDYSYIRTDNHITNLYKYFSEIQNNKITLLGLNFNEFSDDNITIMKLAEDLLYADHLVECVSLYKSKISSFKPPYGANMKYMYFKYTDSRKEKLNQKLHCQKFNYKYLASESENELFHPSCEYNLNKLLKNIKSNTVISTSNYTHPFLDNCTSDSVKNKYYFNELVHNSEEILNEFIPDNQILNQIDLNSEFIDDNFKLNKICTDGLSENKLEEYELLAKLNTSKKEEYHGLCFVNSHQNQISEIIQFGNYLKQNNVENIKIDIIGKCDYADDILEQIYENELFDYVDYLGNNLDIDLEIYDHDFILDFSNDLHAYLLGVLNYKKVFCLNSFSEKQYEEIPDTFVESYDELCQQIYNLHELSFKQLDENYKIVYSKYNQKHFSKNLKKYISM